MSSSNQVISDTVTSNQSLILIKNMFRLSISSVCYLRGIFPSECFSSRDYAGVVVHQLECAEKDEKGKLIIKNMDAFLLSQWLEKGVFDALEKSYLKSLTFAIYAKETETEERKLLETYQFILEYGIHKQIKLNGVTIDRENMKKQAVTFIRCLVEFTNTLDELPDDRYLTMKLAYYDDYTPTDYEPEYFVSAPSDILKFIAPPMKIRIGKLETSHYRLQLKFAGLESLITDDLQQQLVPNANYYNKYPKEDEQLAQKMSNLMKQSLNQEIISSKEDNINLLKRVKKYIITQGKANIKDCVERFKVDVNQIKSIFTTFIEDGIIRLKGKGYEVCKTTSINMNDKIQERVEKQQKQQQHNDRNKDNIEKEEEEKEEEEETIDSGKTEIQHESENLNMDLNGSNGTEENTQTIFATSPPKNIKKRLSTEIQLTNTTKSEISKVENQILENHQPIQKSRKGEEKNEYYYLSQEGHPNSHAKCSIIKDPLYQQQSKLS